MRTTSFRNIGPVERAVRLGLGLILITFAILEPGAWWAYIGVLPLATALIGWCPLYSLLSRVRRKQVAP